MVFDQCSAVNIQTAVVGDLVLVAVGVADEYPALGQHADIAAAGADLEGAGAAVGIDLPAGNVVFFGDGVDGSDLWAKVSACERVGEGVAAVGI